MTSQSGRDVGEHAKKKGGRKIEKNKVQLKESYYFRDLHIEMQKVFYKEILQKLFHLLFIAVLMMWVSRFTIGRGMTQRKNFPMTKYLPNNYLVNPPTFT